ncbi:hypothetical protein BH23GEM9_BH23GEM9_21870 [soil metagenome]
MRRLALAALVLVVACGERRQEPAGESPPEAGDVAAVDMRNVAFATELGVDLDQMTESPEGVYYRDVREGTGSAIATGRTVNVEYKAWLPDGTLFDERPNQEGFGLSEFIVGVSPPVPGLDPGMAGMRVGGVRRIVIPPERGYGLVGRPAGVPAGSPLIFEVRLISAS